jgi:proteasome accessory factor C
VAKDTEKLIRQLSLISFLMAQGRPVSALEIKREVEGYSDMNDDAFARRFYADRAELESLGIQLGVEKPGEGFLRQSSTRCPRRTSTWKRSSSPTRSSPPSARRSRC